MSCACFWHLVVDAVLIDPEGAEEIMAADWHEALETTAMLACNALGIRLGSSGTGTPLEKGRGERCENEDERRRPVFLWISATSTGCPLLYTCGSRISGALRRSRGEMFDAARDAYRSRTSGERSVSKCVEPCPR